jgi:phage baseplate assembly protein W|tara:strand:+ start:963 stop:1370 length:408 start_codon:yes stop_codon:yes gene_type:complete
MAFGARRVFPNDLRPRVAIGVNIPLSGPIAFEPNYQTKDAIRNNLINFLLTNPGERFDNPTFGAGLRNYIFSQVENKNLEFIREDVQDKVNQNFPNIDIEELEVFATENANTIKINLIYSIPNTGINDTLELNFS